MTLSLLTRLNNIFNLDREKEETIISVPRDPFKSNITKALCVSTGKIQTNNTKI